jgi:hypothetical protein
VQFFETGSQMRVQHRGDKFGSRAVFAPSLLSLCASLKSGNTPERFTAPRISLPNGPQSPPIASSRKTKGGTLTV